jgi:GNAT superfamily N-acetyltransferase
LKSRYGLEIRSATSADAAGILELAGQCGRRIESRGLADRLDIIRTGPGAALIATEWGPPSGLVVMHWYQSLGADHPVAQIDVLLVGPENRRRGIGRLMVKSASQAARVAGCDTLELRVPPDDASLAAFGLATGFTGLGSLFVRALRKKT